MRVLGLDYGEKRIGISISDPLLMTAQAVSVITRSSCLEDDIEKIKDVIAKYGDDFEIVIGLPKTMRGEIGPAAKSVLKFVDKLSKKVPFPVITWDERLSTAASERMLLEADLSRAKRKKVIDSSAAQFILQGYLDSKGAKK